MNITNQTNIKYTEYAQPTFRKSDNIKSESPTFCGKLEELGKHIRGQKDCWKLYEDEVLDTFIRSDKDLEDALGNILALIRKNGVKINIQTLYKLKSLDEVNKFFDVVKSKYDIDLNIPPKVYRFVGKSEADALERGERIYPQLKHGKFDVTINPNLDWNKYVITLKSSDKTSILNPNGLMRKNVGTAHEYYYHYEAPSYTIDDVEKIESRV